MGRKQTHYEQTSPQTLRPSRTSTIYQPRNHTGHPRPIATLEPLEARRAANFCRLQSSPPPVGTQQGTRELSEQPP